MSRTSFLLFALFTNFLLFALFTTHCCAAKQIAQEAAQDAVFPMNKRDAQRAVTRAAKQIAQGAALPMNDAERKRREREDAAQAQAAKKEKLQDAVFPTRRSNRCH